MGAILVGASVHRRGIHLGAAVKNEDGGTDRGGPLEARAMPWQGCFSSPFGSLRVSLADRVKDGACLHAPNGV